MTEKLWLRGACAYYDYELPQTRTNAPYLGFQEGKICTFSLLYVLARYQIRVSGLELGTF